MIFDSNKYYYDKKSNVKIEGYISKVEYEGMFCILTNKPSGFGRAICKLLLNTYVEDGQFKDGFPFGYVRDIYSNGSYS